MGNYELERHSDSGARPSRLAGGISNQKATRRIVPAKTQRQPVSSSTKDPVESGFLFVERKPGYLLLLVQTICLRGPSSGHRVVPGRGHFFQLAHFSEKQKLGFSAGRRGLTPLTGLKLTSNLPTTRTYPGTRQTSSRRPAEPTIEEGKKFWAIHPAYFQFRRHDNFDPEGTGHIGRPWIF